LSGIAVLLGLLVLAYVGSILVSGRTIRGFGLPSGAEYVLLGVVLGPHVLGVVERSAVLSFEPILIVGVSWVAFTAGLGYRHVGRRPAHPGRLLFGVLTAAAVGAGVAGAIYFALGELGTLFVAQRRLASLGAGIVLAETTRHMIRWVAERHGARGPLSDWLADMARGSAFVPVAAVAALSASFPHEGMVLPFAARVGVTFGVGIVLGLVAAVLLGREFRQTESWGILIGTTLLGMGVAVRLGLSPLGTSFAMGLTLSLVSRHQMDIRALVQPTEKPVMLPVLLIAGLYVDFLVLRGFWQVIVAALAARVLAELVRGVILTVVVPPARPVGPLIGVGLISTGPMTIACALALNVRWPGEISVAVLNLAVVGVLFGELIGPALLRRALERAGETHAVVDEHEDSIHPLASNPPPPVTEHKA
jgi:hypothetical protein